MYFAEQFRFTEGEIFRPTRMEVDTKAIRENYRNTKTLIGEREIIAAVKGNAYGLGLVPVSKIFYEEGCRYLAVATPEEALALRREGIDREILLIAAAPRNAARALVENDIICGCGQLEFADSLKKASLELKKRARIHLKIDTGMGRFGFFPEQALDAARAVSEMGISIEGAYTHFATSEEANLDYTRWQFKQYMETVGAIEAAGIKIPLKHVCNSGAVLSCPEMYLDAVRPGKLILGIPISGKKYPFTLRNAVEVKTAIVAIRKFPPRSGISYGLKYMTRGEQTIGLLPMGSIDGMSRLYKNLDVLVRGKRVPVVGTVCMDQSMIDLTSVPDAQLDDEVVFIGKQGGEEITVVELMQKLDAIYSQVLALFSFRVPRFYA